MKTGLEPVKVASAMWQAIQALGVEGQRLETDNLIQRKAEAMAEYDKQCGIATAALRLEGEPITIINAIVKGRVSDLLIQKIVAEETLKAHYSKIERLEAQLNALQSLNRFLEHIPNE